MLHCNILPWLPHVVQSSPTIGRHNYTNILTLITQQHQLRIYCTYYGRVVVFTIHFVEKNL